MKNKNTDRKCKDCDTIISYIPRKVRCDLCYKNHLNNSMITTKNKNELTKEQHLEKLKQSFNNIQKLNMDRLIDNLIKNNDLHLIKDKFIL